MKERREREKRVMREGTEEEVVRGKLCELVIWG